MKSNWFKHPLGLSERQQMASLISDEGIKAYGTYMYLVEKLVQEPERKLQLDKLKGFVRKGISLRYLEGIITNHPELFCIEGNYFYAKDKLFSPSFCEVLDERLSKVDQNQSKILNNNSLTISEVSATTRTHVREEKKREEKNHLQEEMPILKKEPVEDGRFKELLRGLTLQSSWGELACMKSGYPKLLMEHFDEAVRLFGEHVVLYGNQYRMGDVSDVQKYFVNFVASGSRTSKELYARLQSLERKQQETAENLYRYEQRIDGKRCYMGCPLPDDAPPRPSPKAIWNNLAGCWHEPTG